MVDPLDIIAQVAQPFIAIFLGAVSWYLRKVYTEVQEVKEENRFFKRAITGYEQLGYNGLLDDQRKTKEALHTIEDNQQQLVSALDEYDLVDGELDEIPDINGPDIDVDDIDGTDLGG